MKKTINKSTANATESKFSGIFSIADELAYFLTNGLNIDADTEVTYA